MTAEISDKLSNWIAQSESWQSFVDFKLPEEDIVDYTIIKRYDDFFISLYCLSISYLDSINDDGSEQILFSLAKGLETFSLKEEAAQFRGINFKEALIFSGALKYLAGYTSSATLTVFPLKPDDFTNDKASFILSFLKREIYNEQNKLEQSLSTFIQTGDEAAIIEPYENIVSSVEETIPENPTDYSLGLLVKALLQKFIQTNIWNTVKRIEDNHNLWADYVEQNIKSKIWTFFPSQLK